MDVTAVRGLEGNWTDGTLVKHFTVFLLNVSLLPLKGLENHITMKTSANTNNTQYHFSGTLCCSSLTVRLHFVPACLLVPSFSCIVQTVFLDVLLDVCGATQGAALGTTVRRLVCVDALVSSEAALVR